VRPHLRKVFENMADLEFKPDKTIIAMYSGEKEKINFFETVDPRDKGVEYWMGEIERMMFKSVRAVLLYSIQDYLKKARTEWILVHPGQCVLNGSQVHWTTEVEEGIVKEGVEGLNKYFKRLDD
jgi:dynein heavy chain